MVTNFGPWYDRETREAPHGFVNLLQLARGQLVPAANSDRVASDDVVARDHPRQRLGPAPLVRVDRRLRRDWILLERTDPHTEAPVVFDRQADESPRPDAVR